MKYLETITDKDLFGVTEEQKVTKKREGARVIAFDSDGKVPFLYVGSRGFYKLPGGGLEEGESIEEALKRECVEEIGCEIEIIQRIGTTKEIRYKESKEQIQHCYLGKIIKVIDEPRFDTVELREKYELKWATLEELIDIFKNDKPSDYRAFFINKREIIFLEEALKLLENNE